MEGTKKLDTIDATPMLSPIELSCLRKKGWWQIQRQDGSKDNLVWNSDTGKSDCSQCLKWYILFFESIINPV